MRKCFKSCLSVITAVSILATIPAEAAVGPQKREEITEEKENAGKREYAEGEALILYGDKGSVSKAFGSKNSDAGMWIEQTYDFEDVEEGITVKSGSGLRAVSSEDIRVSLVKSDIYATEELVAKLGARNDVLIAEPNYKIKALDLGNDTYAKYQWALNNSGQNNGTEGLDINADQEILMTDVDEEERVIALVDTGIDYTHEDLKDVVWNNPVRSSQLRGEHGYDFINYDADPMDDNGHGSHCSGIMAAASGNGVGIEGTAKSNNIKIMALKILNADGEGFGMESVGAYNYIYRAQQLGINVVAINNSWGGLYDEESEIFEVLVDLVGEKGAVSVCAAGNDARDNDFELSLPSGFDSKYLVSVAASNENDELAAFSNYGRESVDLAAPGTDILSTVSYDCFNPGIYEKRDELCSVFEDFSDGNLVQSVGTGDLAQPAEGDIAYGFGESHGTADMSLALSDEAYFGLKGENEKSLKWSVKGAQAGEVYTLYLPYKAGATQTPLSGSIMVKAMGPDVVDDDEFGWFSTSLVTVGEAQVLEDGSVDDEVTEYELGTVGVDAGNYWNHISGEFGFTTDEGEMRALTVTLAALAEGDYDIYLDDMGISKENVEPDAFGKYDFYNGTSMATPYVTGAVAAIANAFPQEDAKGRIMRLFGCTRSSDAFTDIVSTGGVLDLSLIEQPNPVLDGMKLDKDNNICVEGRFLDGTTVYVNDEQVTPLQQSENMLVLDSTGLLNREISIMVEKGERYRYLFGFLSDGKELDLVGSAWGSMYAGSVASDGELVYYINNDGTVSICNPKEVDETGYVSWTTGENCYTTDIFGEDGSIILDYSITNQTDVVCLDGKLWTVLKLDLEYAQESILASYDPETGWNKAADLPEGDAELAGMSLAVYQGKLVLMGGFDFSTGDSITRTAYLDPVTLVWEKGQDLPEGRAFAKAVQTGDKLVVTLGRNNEETVPKTLVFDGKTWKVSATDIGSIPMCETFYYNDDEQEILGIDYYTAQVQAVKGGIVYAAIEVEDMGETLFYQTDADKYVPGGYCMPDRSEWGPVLAACVQDKLYVFQSDLVEDEDTVSIYSMPVQSGCVTVKGTVSDGGFVEGIRSYQPGDIVTLTATAKEGCYVKAFTVNGVNVTKDANGAYCYRFAAGTTGNEAVVSLQVGVYVTKLTMETALELAPGGTFKLKPSAYPENADNKKITFQSENPSVVSVDANGTITVAKNAKSGTKAVITATAADRGTVQAKCTVTVVDAPLPQKGEKAAAGALNYVVTSSTAKKRTVSCTGFAGKDSSKVKIPSTIKINGYTFKVTAVGKNAFAKKKIKSVTIGKNVTSIGSGAFKSCKSLKTISIKSTALKTVGKNAFSGTGSKAVIRVPKKKKKAYTSKLKKAGYTGKIK